VKTTSAVSDDASRPKRSISTRLLVRDGWISGRFHIGEFQCFAEVIADPHLALLKFSDVSVCGRLRIPLLALPRSEVSLIVPVSDGREVVKRDTPADVVRLSVECLLDGTSVRGSVQALPSFRIAGLMRQQRGFFQMHGCTFDDGPLALGGDVPLVLVNATALVGVSEEAQPPPVRGTPRVRTKGRKPKRVGRVMESKCGTETVLLEARD
jgi:hypothetical protein